MTNNYGVVLLVDDDDLKYMFESLDSSGSQGSVQGGSVSSGSSTRNLVGSSVGSEGNSRESNELRNGDILYYRSFNAASMVVSNQEHDMLKIGEVKNPIELTKGMTFESKDKFMNLVKKVYIVNYLEIKVVKCDSITWEVVCKQNSEGCKWSLRGRKRKLHDHFEIMDIKGPYTCVNRAISQDHLNLSSSYIAEMIMDLVTVDPTVSENVLITAIVKEIGYKPSSKKYLKIDGTHLYGKYRGVLLTVTTIDGFHHILPVTFAVVEGKNVSSWTWFMERVRKTVVLGRMGVCVISDRYAGIMSAMKYPNLGCCKPYGYHRFCIRHLAANFAKQFKKEGLKKRVVEMCSQLTHEKLIVQCQALLAIEPRADEWFSEMHPKHLSLACDEGKRFGIMTTNVAESWNNAIKGARKLPISARFKDLYYKVVSYFDQRHIEIEKQTLGGEELTKYANNMMQKWKDRTTGHHVTRIDYNTWYLSAGLQHTRFMSECYNLENAKMVYLGKFQPIADKKEWPLLGEFPIVVAEEDIPKKPGRRKFTRYKNEMDYQGKGKGTTSSAP
ncbi:hypothetical protein AgCh_018677 [Apium graveolens]